MASSDGGFSLLAPTPGATLYATDGITLSWTADSNAPFETFSVMLSDADGPEDWYIYIPSALTLGEGSATLDPSYFVTLNPTQIHMVEIYPFTDTVSAGWTYDDYIVRTVPAPVFLAGSLVSVTPTATTIPESEATSTSTSDGETTGSSAPGEDGGGGGGGGLTTGAKAGIGVGVSVAVLAIVGALFFFFSSFSIQRRRKRDPETRPADEGIEGGDRVNELDGKEKDIAEAGTIAERNPGHELEGKQNEIAESEGVEQRNRGYELEGRQTAVAEAEAVQQGNRPFELEGRRTEIAEAPNTPRNVHELGG